MAEEFLLCPKWVVPVEPAGALEDHAVAVRAGVIEGVLDAEAARSRYPGFERIELPGHVLIPGLINARAACSVASAREDAARAACAEMLAGGITCFAQTCFFPEAALEAAHALGLRAALGLAAAQSVSAYASDFDDYLRRGLALRDRAREEPLASFYLAPLAAHALSDPELRRVAALAAELDLPVQLELEGRGDVERAARLGLLGPNLALANAAHLVPGELERLARHGCSVVLCPSSEIVLGHGAPPLAALLAAGINLAFGTAMAQGSPRLDLFQEMRTAALYGAADAVSAADLLRAATLGGARALGLDGAIGSIAPGKQADLVAVDMRGASHVPSGDPSSWTVQAAGRESVSRVWVGGKLVYGQRTPQNASFPLLDTRGGLA